MIKFCIFFKIPPHSRMLAISIGSLVNTARSSKDQVKQITIEQSRMFGHGCFVTRTRTRSSTRKFEAGNPTSLVVAIVSAEKAIRRRYKRKLEEKRKKKRKQ